PATENKLGSATSSTSVDAAQAIRVIPLSAGGQSTRTRSYVSRSPSRVAKRFRSLRRVETFSNMDVLADPRATCNVPARCRSEERRVGREGGAAGAMADW